jgi:hypothetical protein
MANKPVQSAQQAQFVAGALLASPLSFALIGTGLSMGGGIGMNMDLPVVALAAIGALGAVSLVASIVLRRIMLQRLPEDAPLQRRFSITLVCMALAEPPAAMGLVVVLLTGDLVSAGILWGLGFAGMVHHFPSRAWLEAGENHGR